MEAKLQSDWLQMDWQEMQAFKNYGLGMEADHSFDTRAEDVEKAVHEKKVATEPQRCYQVKTLFGV